MPKITIIGAGSIAFSMKVIPDLSLTKSLSGSTVTLMDISEQSLDTVLGIARRYLAETGADLRIEKTTSREKALDGADFVLNTVKVPSYEHMEAERRIAEKHGYFRGIGDRVSDYYGGIGAFRQLRFFLGLAKDAERLCPGAWFLQIANPVCEGANLVARRTKLKTAGFCHGYFDQWDVVNALGLDRADCATELAGFNHCLWLTKFLHKGENAYPLIDKWIAEKSEALWRSPDYASTPWEYMMSRACREMYGIYDLYPIGDTARSVSPWWFHTDGQTLEYWLPGGGPDSERGWTEYMNSLKATRASMRRIVEEPSLPAASVFPAVKSREHIVPFIESVVTGNKASLVLNVPNMGAIEGIPDDIVIEISVTVTGECIERPRIRNLPFRLSSHVLAPRLQRLERILDAFTAADRKGLVLLVADDPRTRSFEQARDLVEELLAQPWNAEAAAHYR